MPTLLKRDGVFCDKCCNRFPITAIEYVRQQPGFKGYVYLCDACYQEVDAMYQSQLVPCRECGVMLPRRDIRRDEAFPDHPPACPYCRSLWVPSPVVYQYRICRQRVSSADALHMGRCEACRQSKYNMLAEASRVFAQCSRARTRGLAATLTLAEWLKTLDDFQARCAYCGGPFEVLEHFIPLIQGGGTTADNCLPACLSCNSTKSGYTPEQFTRNPLDQLRAYLASRTLR